MVEADNSRDVVENKVAQLGKAESHINLVSISQAIGHDASSNSKLSNDAHCDSASKNVLPDFKIDGLDGDGSGKHSHPADGAGVSKIKEGHTDSGSGGGVLPADGSGISKLKQGRSDSGSGGGVLPADGSGISKLKQGHSDSGSGGGILPADGSGISKLKEGRSDSGSGGGSQPADGIGISRPNDGPVNERGGGRSGSAIDSSREGARPRDAQSERQLQSIQGLRDDLIKELKGAGQQVRDGISQLPQELQDKFNVMSNNKDGSYSKDQLAFIKANCSKDTYGAAQAHDNALQGLQNLDGLQRLTDRLSERKPQANDRTANMSQEELAMNAKKDASIVKAGIDKLSPEDQKAFSQLPGNKDGSFSKEQLSLIKNSCDKDTYSAAQDYNKTLDAMHKANERSYHEKLKEMGGKIESSRPSESVKPISGTVADGLSGLLESLKVNKSRK